MMPEIELLIRHFNGEVWNKDTQVKFMQVLREGSFFEGTGTNDPAFSARDRINRAPKALGFVNLKPVISLTPAGEELLNSKRKDEVFLRQMLKFQIPSPFHKPTKKAATFNVKPYLEMLRLVRTMGTLRFDELQIFGMQLTDYRDFDVIVNKIEAFRVAKVQNKGSYRVFKSEYINRELGEIFRERIATGEIKTRESNDASLQKFLKTQSSNMRDYADACFRYLRSTGLVSVSHVGKSLSIVPEHVKDVDYILENVSPVPIHVDDEKAYVSYLSNPKIPQLYTDDKNLLSEKLSREFPEVQVDDKMPAKEMKELLNDLIEERKRERIDRQIVSIKDYREYNDIQNTYDQIVNKELYDLPLMMEWNTWRAMTMLDGGEIKANLNFDDFGLPLSNATGNLADIVCDYGDYMVCVEVTMQSGQRQYEMEGEPVTRHLGNLKKTANKPCYCLFVAPKIHEACVAHFYTLYHLNLEIYAGTSEIVPLPLEVFRKMLEDSYKADFTPNPMHVRNFFEKSRELATSGISETEWYDEIISLATNNWLHIS